MNFKTLSFIIVCALLACSCKTTKKAPVVHNLPESTVNTDIRVQTENVKLIDQTENVMHEYYVIIGSFRNVDGARSTLPALKNKGFTPVILENENGLYRISVGGYNVENEARAKIAEIRAKYEEHNDVWLLKRKI